MSIRLPKVRTWADAAALPPAMIVRRGESALSERINSTADGRHPATLHDIQTRSGAKRLTNARTSSGDSFSPVKVAAAPSCRRSSNRIKSPWLCASPFGHTPNIRSLTIVRGLLTLLPSSIAITATAAIADTTTEAALMKRPTNRSSRLATGAKDYRQNRGHRQRD